MAAGKAIGLALVLISFAVAAALFSQTFLRNSSLVTVVAEDDMTFVAVPNIVLQMSYGSQNVSCVTASSWSAEPQITLMANVTYHVSVSWPLKGQLLSTQITTPSNFTNVILWIRVDTFYGTITDVSFSPPSGPYRLTP